MVSFSFNLEESMSPELQPRQERDVWNEESEATWCGPSFLKSSPSSFPFLPLHANVSKMQCCCSAEKT